MSKRFFTTFLNSPLSEEQLKERDESLSFLKFFAGILDKAFNKSDTDKYILKLEETAQAILFTYYDENRNTLIEGEIFRSLGLIVLNGGAIRIPYKYFDTED
jgi:hypothetical protein